MASDLQNLETTLSNLIRVRAEASADPKPSYTVNGQQFDWVGYYKWLSEEIDKVQAQIATIDGPYEVVVEGVL